MREYVYNDGWRDGVYCTKYIKQLSKEHYKENIIICSKSLGKADLTFFIDMVASILYYILYYSPGFDSLRTKISQHWSESPMLFELGVTLDHSFAQNGFLTSWLD